MRFACLTSGCFRYRWCSAELDNVKVSLVVTNSRLDLVPYSLIFIFSQFTSFLNQFLHVHSFDLFVVLLISLVLTVWIITSLLKLLLSCQVVLTFQNFTWSTPWTTKRSGGTGGISRLCGLQAMFWRFTTCVTVDLNALQLVRAWSVGCPGEPGASVAHCHCDGTASLFVRCFKQAGYD